MSNGNPETILERLLEPISRCLNVENARRLAEAKPDPVAQQRILELADKCNEGLLTSDERREYETYVQVGKVIAILKAQARLFLKQQKTSA